MSLRLNQITRITITAGSAQALASTKTFVHDGIIQASIGNTGVVYVGGSAVASTNGLELGPGHSVSLSELQGDIGKDDYINIASVYVDGDTNGDYAKFVYVEKE